MRLTSIYTKGDGVVRWERAIVEEADCVEVTGSHIGLMANRKAYRAIADALARPELPGGDRMIKQAVCGEPRSAPPAGARAAGRG